jgi:1-acyl-sn-glycerol-3-phosphate acyltransferase
MKAVLKKGMHMCIYPEGTRNRTSEPLKKFYEGAFKLAESTGCSIIPAVILHTKKALPANKSFYFLPHPVEIHFLPAVEAGNLSAEQIKEIVFNKMKDFYVSHKN